MDEQKRPAIGRTETNYYQNSKQMGRECKKDGGYGDSNAEMTARASACYVKDKLPYQSDYLVGYADYVFTFITGKDGETEILKAYSKREE
ncbi:MAG: LPD1 domain-containing protein, partial [Hungatella sp.]